MAEGIIIVDHGSRSDASNHLLEQVAQQFAQRFARCYPIVEPAHMELAEPSIATAYARCVARGARTITICPYFLGPGKHWQEDIPRLAAEAAAPFPQTSHRLAATLGIDELILQLLAKRIDETLARPLPVRAAGYGVCDVAATG